MNPTVPERFRSELEALCVKYHVELHVGEDMHGDANLYLLQAEEGKGALEIDVELVLREPPKPYVPPPPTPEELARTAELQGLAAASRETWEAGLSKAPTHPEDNPETPDTFDLDGGAGPEEMARRTARAVQVCKALDGGGIDLRVFHLSGELNAVSREATEHAEARSALVDELAAAKEEIARLQPVPFRKHEAIIFSALDPLSGEGLYARVRILERELHAVRVLDAWAEKHEEVAAPAPVFHRYMSPVPGKGMQGAWTIATQVGGRVFMSSNASASMARITAAEALLKEDPSLGEFDV